jgi:two-component system LytT family response regulator
MKESQPGKANPAVRGPAQTFPSGKRFVVVAESAIRWIEARGRRSRIHAVDEVVEADQGISSALAGLVSGRILRIHRSAAVHLDRITSMQPKAHGDWELTMDDGTILTLSRSYRREVLERLKPLKPAEGIAPAGQQS